jgi:molybdopterin-guanine dinucleotide biosynthesis protein
MVKDINHDHHPMELLDLFPIMDIVIAEGFKQTELPKIAIMNQDN